MELQVIDNHILDYYTDLADHRRMDGPCTGVNVCLCFVQMAVNDTLVDRTSNVGCVDEAMLMPCHMQLSSCGFGLVSLGMVWDVLLMLRAFHRCSCAADAFLFLGLCRQAVVQPLSLVCCSHVGVLS